MGIEFCVLHLWATVPLGPILADIVRTILGEVIRLLIFSGTIKFYARFVDDTLVLAKPSEEPNILQKLNSFHSQIQFTHEEFTDNNDVHFLDIKITPTGTTIYRKSTHIGQYISIKLYSKVQKSRLAQITCLLCP